MKEKDGLSMSMKKNVFPRSALFFSFFFILMLFLTGTHTNAAEIPKNKAKITLYYNSHNDSKKATADIEVDMNETEEYEVGLFKPGKANPLGIKKVYYGYYNRARFEKINRNQVYYYAIRTVDPLTGITGAWSKKKAFVCPIYLVKGLKGRDGYPVFKMKTPKIKGVKHYKLYTCQKTTGKYKYVGALKPGKTQKVKFKNSKKILKSYFRLKAVLKNKTSCTTGMTSGTDYDFYIKITW